MKAARLVILGIALAAGGAAALLAANGMRQPGVVEPETIEVLVAKANLSGGHVIGDQDIAWQAWPAAAAYPSVIRKTQRPDAIHQFVGAVMRAPVTTGDPMHDGMASILKPGTRAVSFDFSPTSENGGVFPPDGHVDVVLTSHDKQVEKATGAEKFSSDTIVNDVRVVAMAADKSAMLELTPEQAETLARSRNLGKLSLVFHDDEPRGPLLLVRYGVSIRVPQ